MLEYMAADKPIVSTPITDVAEPYGDMVRIGRRRRRSSLPPASAPWTKTRRTRDTRFELMRQVVNADLVGRHGGEHARR